MGKNKFWHTDHSPRSPPQGESVWGNCKLCLNRHSFGLPFDIQRIEIRALLACSASAVARFVLSPMNIPSLLCFNDVYNTNRHI